MPQVSDNAHAPFVVFAWDGTQAGVVSAWDNEAEARDDAEARKTASGVDHVDFYYADQDGMRDKVAELTGTDVAAFADPSNTRPKNVEGSSAPDADAPTE